MFEFDFVKAAEMGLHRVIKTKKDIKSVFSFSEYQKNTSSTQNTSRLGQISRESFTVHAF